MMCVVRIKHLPDFNMVNKVRQLRRTEQNLVLSTRTGGTADLYCTVWERHDKRSSFKLNSFITKILVFILLLDNKTADSSSF